jgi:hypothetical protein
VLEDGRRPISLFELRENASMEVNILSNTVSIFSNCSDTRIITEGDVVSSNILIGLENVDTGRIGGANGSIFGGVSKISIIGIDGSEREISSNILWTSNMSI